MIKLIEISIAAIILFYLQQFIYQKLWDKNLTATIGFKTNKITCGETGELVEIIENRKKLPLSMLKVKFQTSRHLIFDIKKGSRTTDQYYRNDIFHIGGGEKITRTISFIAGQRGIYSIDNMDLVASDFFLTTEMLKNMELENVSITVFPRPFDNNAFRLALQQLNGEVITKRNIIEDPFEYRGIREYQPYDDLKSINWKATAKTGELKVNQKNYTSLPSLRIFMNLEDKGVLKKEEAVESCFEIAAGLSKYFLNQGISVALYCNGRDYITNEILKIDLSTGQGQLNTINNSLARIDLSKGVASFKDAFSKLLLQENDNSINCIISPNQYDEMVDDLLTLKKMNKSLLWFYPYNDYVKPTVHDSLADSVKLLNIRN